MKSWKAVILIILIALTCMGSLYTALSNIGEAVETGEYR
jgi:ABC-2 type transport system permease protein